MVTEIYQVQGMTCEHCERAVTQELMAVDGVSSVEVALAPDALSAVTVTSEQAVPRERIAAAVDEAGYALVG